MKIPDRSSGGRRSSIDWTARREARRDVLRQKVGARHRILFRIEGAALEIITLIHRKDLERTVKTIVKG